MRGCLKTAIAFGMVALMAGTASAQQGRGGFGGGFGGGGPIGLLNNPGVQKELKLDEAQIEKAGELSTETREQMMGLREQIGNLQGPEAFTKMQELSKPINEAALKTAGEILKPEQLKRLHQIEIQQRGPAGALADAEIAKKLKVTSFGQDRQAATQKIQALRTETNAKVVALMSEEQLKSWKELTGEPFEVTFQPRQGGR